MMTPDEAVVLAVTICDTADHIEIEQLGQCLMIQWIFRRPDMAFFVGRLVDPDDIDIESIQSDIASLLLHSYYRWN